MISLEDCIAMSGLDESELAAIMEHEHVPEIEAAAIASDLLHQPGGRDEVRKMMVEDIRAARSRGDMRHAAALLGTLRRFLEEYPEACLARGP